MTGTGAAAANGMAIEVRGERLVLLPERALFWPGAGMLVAADPHFGKGRLFRDRGIPVPPGTTASDLGRLSRLLAGLRPKALLFLGDLVHGRLASPEAFAREIGRWRSRHADVRMILVTGNHDIFAGGPPAAFGLDDIAPEQTDGPFRFTHKPQPDGSRYNIAGHLHPAITLTGRGRLKETLPCFSFGRQGAQVPAFGSFTGTQVIRPGRSDRIFVVAGDEVLAV